MFRKSEYDIAALLKTILASRHFYSDHAFRQRIKSPLEFVMGAVRAVCRHRAQPLEQRLLVSPLNAMGQALFAPPNVKGWPGGRSWLNTSTLVERANFAGALATGSLWTTPSVGSEEQPPPLALDPARLLREERVNRPDDVVRVLLDLYLPGGVRPEVQLKLVAFIGDGQPTGPMLDRRVREAVHAILSMPEYQLA
jgi:hypothetical protein